MGQVAVIIDDRREPAHLSRFSACLAHVDVGVGQWGM